MAVGERPHFLKHAADGNTPGNARWAAWCVQAADLGLLCALFAVPLLMGGRQPLGQLVLILAASWSALAWSLHLVLDRQAVWTHSRTEWWFAAAAGLALIQFLHLPGDVVNQISPRIAGLLPMWNASADGAIYGPWTQLSLAPAETRSALVVFASYALLFLVAVQRFRRLEDVERALRWIAVAAGAMAAFGLLQYVASNGKFFWIYDHPFTTTEHAPKGSFTNRNHFAQFLALGIGPLIWWVLRLLDGKPPTPLQQFVGRPSGRRELAVALIASALGVVAFAGVLSLSRGGTIALCVAALVCLWILNRRKMVSGKLVAGLAGTGALLCAFLFIYGYDDVADRLEEWDAPKRLLIWDANFRMLKEFPIAGTGIGSHAEIYPAYLDLPEFYKEFTHAESSFLQVGSEAGLAGLGLAFAALFICGGWCVRGLRLTQNNRIAAALAAVTAGLAANAAHAVGDFVWYVPGCMVVVVLLAAAACRLFQMTRQTALGGSAPELDFARIPALMRWAPVGCVVCLAVWMVGIETPRVSAHRHWDRYLSLALDADRREEELAENADLELLEQKLTALRQAAKADPRDARIQLRTALGYLALFHKRQLHSPNRMSLMQIRDAALRSNFESKQQLHDWLERAFGDNCRLMQVALLHTRRAVRLNPLEGRAYLQLARLEFLDGTQHDATAEYVQQAEAVRPYDPHVLFAAGREAWLAREYPAAIDKWKQAFHRHKSYRREIIELMAMFVPAKDFIETFQPDADGLQLMAARYQALGRKPDYKLAQGLYAEALLEQAEGLENREAIRTLREAARAFDQIGRTDDAAKCYQIALENDPNSFNVHYEYGVWAMNRQQWEPAAEHLTWCSKQRPADRQLRKAAEEALEQKLQIARQPRR